MADEAIEFIDCATISIQYSATGAASVSFVVVKNDTNTLENDYSAPTFGGVNFDGIIMSAVQRVIIGSGGWCEWQIQLQGVGNK